jgi:hypothetical protein
VSLLSTGVSRRQILPDAARLSISFVGVIAKPKLLALRQLDRDMARRAYHAGAAVGIVALERFQEQNKLFGKHVRRLNELSFGWVEAVAREIQSTIRET